jgi:hypothetical protein
MARNATDGDRPSRASPTVGKSCGAAPTAQRAHAPADPGCAPGSRREIRQAQGGQLLGDRTNAAREVATFKRLSPGSASANSQAAGQIADNGRSVRKLFQGIRLALAIAS